MPVGWLPGVLKVFTAPPIDTCKMDETEKDNIMIEQIIRSLLK